MDYIVFARNARGVQGLRASRRARLDCAARDNRMQMQVPAGAEGASAAEGRAASGRCGRRPQHRCERADARDCERAAREHRMRSRCAAGAEGARAAEGRVAPPPPTSTSLRNFWVLSEWGFHPLQPFTAMAFAVSSAMRLFSAGCAAAALPVAPNYTPCPPSSPGANPPFCSHSLCQPRCASRTKSAG